MLIMVRRTPGYMGPPTIGGGYFATPPKVQHVQAPPVLKPYEEVCELEHVLFMWF